MYWNLKSILQIEMIDYEIINQIIKWDWRLSYWLIWLIIYTYQVLRQTATFTLFIFNRIFKNDKFILNYSKMYISKGLVYSGLLTGNTGSLIFVKLIQIFLLLEKKYWSKNMNFKILNIRYFLLHICNIYVI